MKFVHSLAEIKSSIGRLWYIFLVYIFHWEAVVYLPGLYLPLGGCPGLYLPLGSSIGRLFSYLHWGAWLISHWEAGYIFSIRRLVEHVCLLV